MSLQVNTTPVRKLGTKSSVAPGGRPWLACEAFAFVTLAIFGPAAAARKKRAPLPPPTDLPGHVNYLVRELNGVQLDDAEPITKQVQALVLDDLDGWINAHPPQAPNGQASGAPAIPYDVKVRRRIEHDFSLLHYPFICQAAVFAQPWRGGTLVGAGYMLGWTDQDRSSVIAFFEVPASGKARLATVVHFTPGADLHYAFPTPSGGAPQGQFWVLAYGDKLGKSHPRLAATLYTFDGESAKSLWQADNVYDGQLEAEGARVVIRHMKEQEFVQAAAQGQAAPRYQAVYNVTPSGLELESDREMKQ